MVQTVKGRIAPGLLGKTMTHEHLEVGAPIFVHPPIFEMRAPAILDVLEKEGAHFDKVVM